MTKYSIGFVDEDPQEIRRYANRLEPMGFEVIDYNIEKGLDLDQLLNLIYESEIDLVMVDFLLNERGILGFNGDAVIREFKKIKPEFPMIIFTSKDKQAFPLVDDVNLIYDKARIRDDDTELERFIAVLSKNIEKYRKDVSLREERIKKLIAKRESGNQLNTAEKAELYRFQFELSNLDQRTKDTPDHLLVELKLDQLSTTIEEAEEFLKKLKEEGDDDPNTV